MNPAFLAGLKASQRASLEWPYSDLTHKGYYSNMPTIFDHWPKSPAGSAFYGGSPTINRR